MIPCLQHRAICAVRSLSRHVGPNSTLLFVVILVICVCVCGVIWDALHWPASFTSDCAQWHAISVSTRVISDSFSAIREVDRRECRSEEQFQLTWYTVQGKYGLCLTECVCECVLCAFSFLFLGRWMIWCMCVLAGRTINAKKATTTIHIHTWQKKGEEKTDSKHALQIVNRKSFIMSGKIQFLSQVFVCYIISVCFLPD